MLKTIVTCGAAAAVLSMGACSTSNGNAAATTAAASAGAPASPVRVARAEVRNVPVELAAVGNVEPFTTIVVKAQIGGVLTRVFFNEGAMVKEGATLFEIDRRPYEEAIRQAEANLAREKAILQQNEAQLASAEAQDAHYNKQAERYAKLAAEGVVSQELADQAGVEARARRTAVRALRATIESTKASIAASDAALGNARLNLTYCTIKSPINGRTGSIKIKRGNLVKANDAELVTIHQIQPVYVSFSVPEEHLGVIRRRVAAGNLSVSASVPQDDRPGPAGRLTFLENAVDTTTGTIRLKANFANADARLWPGQFVDVKLKLEDMPHAIVVPVAALQTGQKGNYLYVVRADQSVELRPVTPGPRVESLVAVQTGLEAGETVVTEGQMRLAPGAKVQVQP